MKKKKLLPNQRLLLFVLEWKNKIFEKMNDFLPTILVNQWLLNCGLEEIRKLWYLKHGRWDKSPKTSQQVESLPYITNTMEE